MKILNPSLGELALAVCLLTLGVSCGGDKTFEGTVETMLAMEGINEEGLQFTIRNTFVCREGKFRLLLLSDACEIVGFERQKEGEGFALDIGGKSIVLHSEAVYRVRGEILDAEEGEELKRLKATHFELMKPGVGKSKTKAGF